MNFKKLLFGEEYLVYKTYDEALRCFDKSDYLTFDFMIKQCIPDNYQDGINFLINEGLAERIGEGLRITPKGKLLRKSGGMMAKYSNKRINIIVVLVTVIAAIISILAVFGIL